MRYLLFPFSVIYGIITWFRNKLYDWKIFHSTGFDIPLVSIGNLSVGGTGKTPHIEYLVRLLKDKYTIATLSRGYGRKTSGFIIATEESTAKEVGDEPKQFCNKFEDITVSVCEKRVRGVKKLLALKPEINTILLDDAFQHRAINPGLSIILTDFSKIFNKNFILPTGTLRESGSGAKRADIIIISKTPKIFSPIERRRILNEIKVYPHHKLFFSYIKYGKLTPVPFCRTNYDLCKISVTILFTGIANPSPLEEHLKRKCDELKVIRFPDHHTFTIKDLEKVKQEYSDTFQKNKIIITTEKDLMRLDSPELQQVLINIPVFYIPIEIAFHNNDSGPSFDEVILDYLNKSVR